MWQQIGRYARGALIGAVWLAWLTSAEAATTVVHEDFEDGQYTGDKTNMAVPPVILTESGNKFLRVTGSASDKDDLGYCGGTCPNTNRSTISFTKEALLNNLPKTWTYSVDMRVVSLHAQAFEVNPISITVNNSEGYCGNRIQVFGPSAAGTNDANTFYYDRRLQNPSTGSFRVELVGYTIGQWNTLRMEAVWSTDGAVGKIRWYINNVLQHTFSGNTHPVCGFYTPETRYGLYGDFSRGVVDFDNIHIFSDVVTPPPCS